ncbi:MAG: DNA ligase B [Candidatus Nitrosopelagicus brevis]|uniref:DNA ligase n=1 Tax=Candidatus Nitrosopelagicus brevis TaxID=1410606 RepID=A0A0A7V964_9ARCH|nr:ATP-dependent DNA ligase [Candidatus Nitrosopelagicus brevis]AJA93190.1 ATP-dependent DNA ligase domain protein [Candidatus Nitrosopelagicus brevis]PTL88100.1 ATP-dependent DNA ligase [Candidatus Nitrosopelagicus brevis]CAI8198225.1 MAG: DNA ligase B [Candidatus Nitrosopelagicus brevis]
MKFSIISDAFQQMEATTKRLELTDILVKLIQEIPEDVIAKAIYLIQGKLRPNFEGVELGIAEKLVMRAMSKSSGIPLKKIEDDYNKGGDLGQTAENILQQKIQTTFASEVITLEKVYDTLFKISKLEGKGSQEMKMKYVSSMLNDATPQESKFILKILLGTLRLGIAENTVMDALAIAFTGKKENREIIENAYNVSSDLGKVAEVISTRGVEEIEKFQIKLFSPIRPMLADRIKSGEETVEKFQEKFAAEYKLDGERAQIHKQKDKIEIFSRSLEIITSYYPDIVEKISKLIISEDVILEAEVVAMNSNSGDFLPFQELMHRRRKYEIEEAVTKYPITVNFFDVLFSEGKNCMDMRYEERRELLEKIIKQDDFARLIPMSIIESKEQVLEVLENSINSGCEGLMLKHLDSTYRAGIRGSNWLKLKREYQNELGDSLDLVVVGAFFGKGRRTGKYGTLLLSTYNDEEDVFPSICKVGTGFTDESLDQLYQILSPKVTLKKNPRIVSEMEADVWFEPELVIEIVASEITQSPIHKTALDKIKEGTGLALRFPKFTGKIRTEKNSEDASTDEEVIALYKVQKKTENQE